MFENKCVKKLTSLLLERIPSHLRIEKASEGKFNILNVNTERIYLNFEDPSFSLDLKSGFLKIGSRNYKFYSKNNFIYIDENK